MASDVPPGTEQNPPLAKGARKKARSLLEKIKHSAEAVAASIKLAGEAEAAAKKAAEKLSAAKIAAEKMPDKEELLAARMAAESAVAEPAYMQAKPAPLPAGRNSG